ncbi:DUF1800 domain-containing protein [Sphingobacteriales bacterium UPWRP_1]|nr:hypothetical protein B6N25_12760 [Sphingobacteriales bacterium TSM_CSS]PSJ76961.1 DUF1800 domain-containing protein [Sphingobacteriales bacterium UPWRP_1]
MSCATGSIAPYTPSANVPWDRRRVAHLYRRMGFGATNSQITAGLAMTPTALVDQIINQALALPLPTQPVWYDWTRYPVDDYTDFGDESYSHRIELTRQWISNMLAQGFKEKLTLFWHNHFVTEWNNYNCSAYLFQYHKLLHQYALGNFKLFAHYIGITPAMLLYLNGNQNEVGSPNQNYARELMELFTMGQNNGYTEDDIEQMARALTGWKVPYSDDIDAYTCADSYFDAAYFDNTAKTIFGQTGMWRNDADPAHPENVVNLIFSQRADEVAGYICTKLYRFYIANDVDTDIVAALADTFKNNNFEITPVLRQLFKSEHFFDEANIGHLIKSPMELAVGLHHTLQIPADDNRLNGIFYDCADMAQELFEPVNVAGWPGYRTWINENNLTRRWDYAGYYVYYVDDATLDSWVELAKNLTNDSNDPAVVTAALVDFLLPKGMETPAEYETATDVFKGSIPQNYFDEGLWNLDWAEARDQIRNLLLFLVKQPSFQLN